MTLDTYSHWLVRRTVLEDVMESPISKLSPSPLCFLIEIEEEGKTESDIRKVEDESIHKNLRSLLILQN